jgi:hypothetical protein
MLLRQCFVLGYGLAWHSSPVIAARQAWAEVCRCAILRIFTFVRTTAALPWSVLLQTFGGYKGVCSSSRSASRYERRMCAVAKPLCVQGFVFGAADMGCEPMLAHLSVWRGGLVRSSLGHSVHRGEFEVVVVQL